jgi:4,5-DOPA dioxygenase extradiol
MKMPVLFVGHGSPMNAIEDNEFSQNWKALGKRLTIPKAILAVSAHWYTNGTRTSDVEHPIQIYDMYGFPPNLYELKYPGIGSPSLAENILQQLGDKVIIDNRWGIDHGTWSVLTHMFPEATIPIVQLSIDYQASTQGHFALGERLKPLRDQGVLIIGSGNVVHNLSLLDWDREGGYPWAEEFDEYIKTNIRSKSYDKVIDYQQAGKSAEKAFYTPDHYDPLLYVIGASEPTDRVEVFNERCMMGAMSMTGYLFESQ